MQELHSGIFPSDQTGDEQHRDWSDTIPLPAPFSAVSLQACAPFQGCFEKVEEWLDENKHLLGTIGMVILVVQVGGLVINWSFSLYVFASLPSIFPFPFPSIASCLGACGYVCLSGNKQVHPMAPVPPPSTQKLMKPVLSGRSVHPHILKYWSHCLLQLTLSGGIKATWICAKQTVVMYKEPSEDRRAEILNKRGAGIESQIKGSVERGDHLMGHFLFFVLNSLNPPLDTRLLFHFSLFAFVFPFSWSLSSNIVLRLNKVRLLFFFYSL